MKSNKMFFIFSVIMVVFVVGVFMKSRLKSFLNSNVEGSKHAEFRVAILVPASHPALEEIRKGFIDTLSKSVSCSYDEYNANGNRTLMRNQAEEIVAKKYDLIFAIAAAPALLVKEVCEQRHSSVPVVAGAIENPVDLKLISSMESSGNNITAVAGIYDFEEQLKLLKFLKPEAKNILLVYNPTSGLDDKKQELEVLCKNNNIGFYAIEIFNLNDLVQKVPAVIGGSDVVMVLRDNLVVSGIESLINLCNRMQKTLYASDLNSGDKGAALSYGVYESGYGIESAYKAIDILKHGKNPSEIPSSACRDFKIKVNTKTMALQKLDIDANVLQVMKSGEVI